MTGMEDAHARMARESLGWLAGQMAGVESGQAPGEILGELFEDGDASSVPEIAAIGARRAEMDEAEALRALAAIWRIALEKTRTLI